MLTVCTCYLWLLVTGWAQTAIAVVGGFIGQNLHSENSNKWEHHLKWNYWTAWQSKHGNQSVYQEGKHIAAVQWQLLLVAASRFFIGCCNQQPDLLAAAIVGAFCLLTSQQTCELVNYVRSEVIVWGEAQQGNFLLFGFASLENPPFQWIRVCVLSSSVPGHFETLKNTWKRGSIS